MNDSVAAIQTDVTANATDIAAETTTRTSQIASLNDSVAAIQTDVTANATDIAAETTARTAQIAATDAAVASLTTSVATNASALAAEVSARTTQVATQNQSIATLDQEITTVASNLASEVTTLETAIANVGTDTAAVTEIVNARVDPLEDAVEASYVLRANANNTVAGFSLFNSTAEPSSFDIVADRFSVSPSYTQYGNHTLAGANLSNFRANQPVYVHNYFGTGQRLWFNYRTINSQSGVAVYFDKNEYEANGGVLANTTMSVLVQQGGTTLVTKSGPVEFLFSGTQNINGVVSTVYYWGLHAVCQGPSGITPTASVLEAGSNVTPFTVDGTTGTVFMNAAMIKDATITNAMIEEVAAEKVTAIQLSSIAANLGEITAGSLTGPNGRFQIDLANNRLDVFDENGTLRVRLGDLS